MKNSPEIIDIKKTYLAISLMLLAILCVDSYMVVIKFLGDDYSIIQLTVFRNVSAVIPLFLLLFFTKEYFTVLGKLPEELNVVSPAFKDYKNGKYKIISFYAKKARGLMARWIIQNKVTDFEALSGFNVDGYKYSKAESTATVPVFLRKP